MATEKQKLALEKMVENGGVASRAMEEAGYSKAMAKNPHKLTRSLGFKSLLEECGLTESLIVTSLVEDIKKKPQNRVKELSLASEITGLKKKEETVAQNIAILTINYGETNNNPVQLRAEELPATTTESDGQWEEESGVRVASKKW